MTGFDLYGSKTVELDDGEDLGHKLEGDAPEEPLRNSREPVVNLTIHDLMVRMQRGLVEDLLDRLESKTATHQELAIIQRMLNDAGYVVDRDDDASSSSAPEAKSDLPSFEGEDYDQ